MTNPIFDLQNLPVLDVDIEKQQDGSSKFKIYRKNTHTDQYLNFTSHHPLNQKLGVVRTLLDRANALISTEEDKKEEIENVKKALRVCKYPNWCFKKVEEQMKKSKEKTSKKKKDNSKERRKTPGKTIVLPYLSGLSEAAARIFRKFDRSVSFRPAEKLGQRLFKLKDKADPMKRAHSIYEIPCKNCEQVYIGETNRPLYIRKNEHQKETSKISESTTYTRQQRKQSSTSDFKSAIAEHATMKNHIIDWEGIRCLEQEQDWRLRGIKEAIHIRGSPNNMNRPQGERFILSHIWDTLLQNETSQNHGRGSIAPNSGTTTSAPTRSRGKGPRGRGPRI